MGIRQNFREALDLANRHAHINEQGFPDGFGYLAQGYEPGLKSSGEFSAEARDEYAEEKARRDPLGLDPFG